MRGCARAAGRRVSRHVVLGGAGEDFARGGRGNNLGAKARLSGSRWHTCSLCEQGTTASCNARSVGVPAYVGRPEADYPRSVRQVLGTV